MFKKLLLITITVAFISACKTTTFTTVGSAKNFGVSVEAKPAQSNVKVLAKAQGWNKNGKNNGYVGYGPGESGLTLFTVKKEDLSDTCAGTAEWVITRMRLSSEGNTTTEKGSKFGAAQPAWLQEAFPDVDLADGVLLDVSKEEGRTFLIVQNDNAQAGYRFIYYELTLTRCSDGLALVTDPGWGNGGKR